MHFDDGIKNNSAKNWAFSLEGDEVTRNLHSRGNIFLFCFMFSFYLFFLFLGMGTIDTAASKGKEGDYSFIHIW